MQELALGTSAAPHADGRRSVDLGGVELGQQGRDHMAVLQVEIVARPVEIGRHDRHEVAAILPARGLAEHKEIGRASCRERVCQYVKISAFAVSSTQKNKNVYN